MYNGQQSQANMNQHNPYSGGQIPPPQGFVSIILNLYIFINYKILKIM